MPKRPKVWFGTLNDMRWIDAPVANFQSNSTGFNYSATTLRGDGFAKRSALTHREFTLTWAANTVAEHAALLYLLSTNELLYYVDPLAMKTNLLPGFMSHYIPNATVFTDDIPHVATPGAYNGAPAWSWNPAWIMADRSEDPLAGGLQTVGGVPRGRDDPDKRHGGDGSQRVRRPLRHDADPYEQRQQPVG